MTLVTPTIENMVIDSYFVRKLAFQEEMNILLQDRYDGGYSLSYLLSFDPLYTVKSTFWPNRKISITEMIKYLRKLSSDKEKNNVILLTEDSDIIIRRSEQAIENGEEWAIEDEDSTHEYYIERYSLSDFIRSINGIPCLNGEVQCEADYYIIDSSYDWVMALKDNATGLDIFEHISCGKNKRGRSELY